jgi:hypothetical protein
MLESTQEGTIDIERIPKSEPEPSLPPSRVPVPGRSPLPAYPESLRRIFRNRNNLNWETQSGFHGGRHGQRRSYKLAMWSLAASVIDGLLLVAMNLVFMMVFLKIVRTPITANVAFDFALIFVCGTWMYMITTRFFIGCSIGEAACDLRLGKPQERLSRLYFLKVLVRASLVTATGLLLFPVLSLVTGKDLAGKISGVQLFSLK